MSSINRDHDAILFCAANPADEVFGRDTLQRVEKVVAAEPDHGSAMSFGVTALVSLGERERAIDWAERAILLDPENMNLRYNLGCSMIQLGEFDRGLDFVEYAVARSQQQGINWFVLDNDLDPVRDHPRFKSMLAAAQARLAADASAKTSPS